MPALSSKSSTVLVTGANGFLPMHAVNTLLEKGYTVIGTVRSSDKGDYVKNKFAKYGDKLRMVVVEDIGKEGAFDEYVKVDGVMHMASPFHLNADDPEEMIQPAVNGTTGILKSISKNSNTVKRVVITSSCAAVQETPDKPTTFTEANWNEKDVADVKKNGRNAANGPKYQASKSLAEKAAWQFVEEKSPKWDLVAINPPYIFGPLLQDIDAPSKLNTSSELLYKALTQEPDEKTAKGYCETKGSWVDVRDVALAHVLALETPEAGGQRIIVSAGSFAMQDFLDASSNLSPDPRPSKPRPKGTPRGGANAKHMIILDTSRMKKIFGDKLKMKTMEETARDALQDFERRGW